MAKKNNGNLSFSDDFAYASGVYFDLSRKQQFEAHKIVDNWVDGKPPLGNGKPAYSISAEGPGGVEEIGGIWMNVAKSGPTKGQTFIGIQMDSGSWDRPINNVSGFAQDEARREFNLVFSRPKPRKEAA